MAYQQRFSYPTKGRGTYDITDQVNAIIRDSGTAIGLCNVFIQHTSASLIITENADRTVREDIETVLHRFNRSVVVTVL